MDGRRYASLVWCSTEHPMISRALKAKLRKAVDSYYAKHDVVTGRKIQIPKGFRIDKKTGKLARVDYQYGTASAIIAKRKNKRVRVAKGPKA